MHKRSLIAVLVLIVLVAFTLPCFAEDVMLEGKVTRTLLKKDKSGNPYAVTILQMSKELNGVKYNGEQAVFAFGSTYTSFKDVKPGASVKGIAKKGKYQGSDSYSWIQKL